jgi:hypothetical protein
MIHPNSLANLNPIKPGEVRNPTGKRSAAWSVREWWNAMSEWSHQQIEAIANDVTETAAKRAAAQRWIAALDPTGRPGDELDRILDQTGGKPKQQVEVSGGIDHKIHAVMGAALNDPETLKFAKQMAARAKALTNDSGTGTN